MNRSRHVYGPVPSRRLGQSLGIDPIPLKTCNWNCVYCQLGRTRPLTNARRDYFPPDEMMKQVAQALEQHRPGQIDWVTFVGSGEPTLHASLGWMIRQVKKLTDLPVAVITNGSLLCLPQVRQELVAADAVLPALDAGSAELYRGINRPHPEISFRRLTEGLAAFRQVYAGSLWPEVMLVRGFNDTEQALRDLADRFRMIRPDQVHLSVPSRPPAETWVQPPTPAGLQRAVAILGNVAKIVHPAQGTFERNGSLSVVDSILEIITRHPMRQRELEASLAQWAPGQVRAALEALERSGKAQLVMRMGARFWTAAHAFFPDETHSRRSKPTLRAEQG